MTRFSTSAKYSSRFYTLLDILESSSFLLLKEVERPDLAVKNDEITSED